MHHQRQFTKVNLQRRHIETPGPSPSVPGCTWRLQCAGETRHWPHACTRFCILWPVTCTHPHAAISADTQKRSSTTQAPAPRPPGPSQLRPCTPSSPFPSPGRAGPSPFLRSHLETSMCPWHCVWPLSPDDCPRGGRRDRSPLSTAERQWLVRVSVHLTLHLPRDVSFWALGYETLDLL